MATVPTYANRSQVKQATRIEAGPISDREIDRVVAAASRRIERYAGGRKFYPWSGTRSFDWPHLTQRSHLWRLYLNSNEVLSVSALTAGGNTIASDKFYLEPVNDGPPYRWIDLDLADLSSFDTLSSTHQRAITVTGVFGYGNATATAGTLTASLDASETTVALSSGATVDAGDAIKVDSEYMIVTGSSWAATSDTLTAALTTSGASNQVPVTDGTAYTEGEMIIVGGERMLVTDVVANTLTVKRGWEHSTPAAHAIGAAVSARRSFTVERAALGTSAASHSSGATVLRHVPPADATELCIAETLVELAQHRGSWAREVGQGETAREVKGVALAGLRRQFKLNFGQRGRVVAAGGMR